MSEKIVNQLPVVLQTKAVKNFFEATVEQLYSQANVVPLNGFIGKKTGSDRGLTGAFIPGNTADRQQYNLSPAVNNINPISGDSENLVFYDELIDILNVYGVSTQNHNRIFGSRYRVFMPPIDIDKFINYQEYYWYPQGPSTITISATSDATINIEKDVLGKKQFSYGNPATTLRNGMIVLFEDNNNTIPAASSSVEYKAGVEYIVGGVGDSIYLTPKSLTTSTVYGGSDIENKDYIVIQRGAKNSTAWSRVNHWYHRNNFKDVGDDLPSRDYRAQRPIIEFDRNIEMYNHGTSTYGIATVNVNSLSKSEVEGIASLTIDTKDIENGDVLFFPNESLDNRKFLYTVSGVGTSIVLTATSSTAITVGQSVVVSDGSVFKGIDFVFNGNQYAQAQQKSNTNQAPLFVLYDDNGNRLDNQGLYGDSSFEGSKIFGYKEGTGVADSELGFALSYTPYKAVSEIAFENFIQSETVTYQAFGSSSSSTILGSYYYKLIKDTPEYHSYWKLSPERNEQKIITTHYITQVEIDDGTVTYNIGAIPSVLSSTTTGYDIMVTVNGVISTNYTYEAPSSIKFNSFDFKKGDIIDVEVGSSTGISKISDSRYEIPLSWKSNPFNQEIEIIAEPEYLSHFKRYIERQENFSGDPLGANNFDSTEKDLKHAKDIVQTDQDLILATFMLDDQPHNLVDALRFTSREYEKYRARLRKEIKDYLDRFDTSLLSNEYVLERVLRNLISYSIGKDVFGTTYVLPFGDNYIQENFDVADIAATEYVLSNYSDLNDIANSLLVYKLDSGNSNSSSLLTVDVDYTISSYNPITVNIVSQVTLGDTIVTKLYDKDRDSAECPPTPSTMGLYPLFVPRIETDNSFQTPIQVLVGHDGSRTILEGDKRDDLLLEFEKRLYNSATQQFRTANSLPALNVSNVRSGYFRQDHFAPREYADLLRNSFTNWVGTNKADYVTNEYFDSSNTWTWNYRGDEDVPGHWRGWFEYYYDTVRPHTHPWEMLGFFEKPTWWETQYGTDYGSLNTALWSDLEQGIIRQGHRENFTDDTYLIDNNWRREGLSELLPVNSAGELLSPGEITSTGTTTRIQTWTNRRPSSTDVSDQFKDVNGVNNLPNGINVTYGSAAALRVLFDAPSLNLLLDNGANVLHPDYPNEVGTNPTPNDGSDDTVQLAEGYSRTQAGTFWDYDGTISSVSGSPLSFGSGFTEGFDGFETPYVYVKDIVKNTNYQLFNYEFNNLTDSANIVIEAASLLPNNTVGITVTGVPILNPANVESWNNESTWYYSNTFRNNQPEHGTYFIEPQHAGLTEWDTAEHSPVVGWSFDGLPIYGPYGYSEYASDGSVADSTIVNIKSAFSVKTGTRSSGPGGTHTGEFVQDYTYDLSKDAQPGYTGSPAHGALSEYNLRYGVTPDSAGQPIYFYVATIDDNGDPMFPYVFGGTESVTNTYRGKYYTETVPQVENNNTGAATGTGELVAISSTLTVTAETDSAAAEKSWRFGDGAPVENAWKYSVGYPFAVVEALLLSKPGRFVTVFSDPTRITSPTLDKTKIINTVTRKPFDFTNFDHFCIHGSVDAAGNTVRNVGYSQFVHSWLSYQKLNTTTDYADKLKGVNVKLAHRVAGFTDKDTLTVRVDQTSLTSTSSSLIIPQENIDVVVHSSPYKNRNFYSGVIIQKTNTGYKVRGYDKNFGYFNVLRRSRVGRRTSVEVGGTAVDFTNWQANTSYPKGTIVAYNNSYYEAPTLVPSSTQFIASLWKRLPSLPQTGSVKATLFLDNLPYIDRVDYETEFSTPQDVVDMLVGLGQYQESLGFDFAEFDNSINDVRNWNYTVKQFLFWVAGGWENNNTIELSPLANKVTFNSTTGMVAEINRVDKNQFTLIDQNSAAIQPNECEIVRQGNTIEIVPPAGTQIYGVMLFTKEIEHALVFDNVTDFNDTLFNPVYNQLQTRLKVKGKKTANWSGLFSSEGFIIQNDELRPNLDNMAQSLGRYHELGFIPVEKQIYEQARGLFGYRERTYLTDLQIEDDDQFEFYKGMLQSKGTIPSLSKIAKSNNIIQGEMTVYDEWAFRVGDFGDLENDQSIELKLAKNDVVHDPQLITLVFPEDTTGVVEEVRVLEAKHRYFSAPTIEIAAPDNSPKQQATARATLHANGVLSAITVTNAGTGYAQPVSIEVVAGNTFVSNISTTFNTPVAVSSDSILESDIAGLGLSTVDIQARHSNGALVSANIDVSSATEMANIVSAINNDASVNSLITATSIDSRVLIGNTVVSQAALSISGNEFNLFENANNTLASLNLTPGNYQPKQRYSVASVGNHPTKGTGATTADDIIVKVDGNTVLSDGGNNWVYDAGSRQTITFAPSVSDILDVTGNFVTSGNVNVTLPTPIDANNIVKENGISYPFVDVFVNGVQLVNLPGQEAYSLTTTQLTIHNVETTLINGQLPVGANIYVVESATVDFEPSYFGDIPGATLNIKTTTDDSIAILTGTRRLYEITKDDRNDDVITIDIDDTERFLKKPLGVREQSLWPTTSNVDFTGITDERFIKMPNAGYVNKADVDFRSFSVPDIADMFRPELLTHPDAGDLVHVAISENRDWNVYRFNQSNSDVSFIEQEELDATAYLYSNVSLFEFTDQNQINSNNDSKRYLDYHIAIKDAVVSDKFVLWVNEEVVDQKQVRLSNITPISMMEQVVSSIGPNNLIAITNIEPGISGFAAAEAEANIDGSGTVRIYTNVTSLDNDPNLTVTVGFAGANTHQLFGNTYTASNINISNGTFTINEPLLSGNIDAGNLVARFFNRTQITAADHGLAAGQMVKIVAGAYSGQWLVEGASANTFIIDTPYISTGPTTGNAMIDEVLITTVDDHGLASAYAGKKVVVHNADERFYNRVYFVKDVPTANTILVKEAFPFTDQTTSTGNTCVVTTLDHNMISLNNTNIKIDNINSLDGMIDSLNRAIELRSGWIGRQGSFNFNIPMLRSTQSRSTGLTPNQVAGGNPFVNNFSGINTSNIVLAGSIPVNPAITQKVGFNKNSNGQPSLGTRPLPRTVSSGANTRRLSSTINTSPFNAYVPGSGAPAGVANPFALNMTTNFGIGPNGPGAPITVGISSTSGAGTGGSATGAQFTPNVNLGGIIATNAFGVPNPSGSMIIGGRYGAPKTPPAPPVAAIPKVVVTKPNGSGSTNNTGATVLNGGVVATVPTKSCGDIKIPSPPPQPPQPPVITPAPPPATPTPPPNNPAPVHMKCEFQEQSSTQRGKGDTWSYMIPVAGKVKMVIDMDGAADSLIAWQVTSNSAAPSSGRQLASTARGVRKATADEKRELMSSRNLVNNFGTIPGLNLPFNNLYTNMGSASYPRDFTQVGNGFTNCGVIEFNFDPQAGGYLKIVVTKPSSVYRYMICYPTNVDPGKAKNTAKTNPNPGQLNTGVHTGIAAPNTSNFPRTPILIPSGAPTTKNRVAGNTARRAGGGFRKNANAGTLYQHNFGGFSLAPMAGFTHIPSVFKKTVKTVNPENVGRQQSLTAGRYVNTSVQRASGGRILPLAAPVPAPIAITPRGIKGVDLRNYPGSSTLGSSSSFNNLNIDHNILRIASSKYDVQNLSVPGSAGSLGTAGTAGSRTAGTAGTAGSRTAGTAGSRTAGTAGSRTAGTAGSRTAGTAGTLGVTGARFSSPGDTINSDGTVTTNVTTIAGPVPYTIPGSLVYDATVLAGSTFADTIQAPVELDAEDAPVNLQPNTFSTTPVVIIQPKKKVPNSDGTFSYEPAGPKAYVPIYAPTPSVKLSENDMVGLTPGDELIVNNQPITIPGSPAAALKEFECAGGFGFTTSLTTKNGNPAVKLSSCTNAPITVRDGCRGGVYKEVLDFHIVKNFSLTDISNDAYDYSATTTGTHVSGITTATVNTTTNTSIPNTTAGVNHTGGKGYSVGDRLRVVGGTPVASPFGSVQELCVEIPGLNYTSEANVRVFIGDGTTPGAEAEAGTVKLNSDGGIESVALTNTGVGYDPARPPVVRIVDIGESSSTEVIIPAKIRPIIKTQALGADGKMHDTYGLPERPAKFIVTAVNSEGSILSLKVIDRGVYKEFPADLTSGVVLEYDGINLGDEHDGSIPPTNATGLGQYHPITYEKLDSPGNYDPIRGKYGAESGHGQYGTGARIFLTAREIPDCSEKGDVRTKLGFPEQILTPSMVEHLADLFNEALHDAGYSPNDISFGVNPINDDLDELSLSSPLFDGVEFDELTPGFLDKLGLPPGDYNPDQTPLVFVDGTPTNDTNLTSDPGIRDIIDGADGNTPGAGGLPGTGGSGLPGSGGSGLPGSEGSGFPGSGGIGGGGLSGQPGVGGTIGTDGRNGSDATGTDLPEETMVIYGVDEGGFRSDGSSILGNANVTYIGDLYQYELRTLDGGPVTASNDARNCRVLYLESERYSTESDIANIAAEPNVWVDNYQGNGWAYLENGVTKRNQTALVDPTYIRNTIIYDSTTGEKDFDYDMWDPFKGIIPAFIDAEISYFGQNDPVVYTTRRAVFGKDNVGQVWWNTSTIRYNWYEQGTNRERWLNWGSAFPGSGITLYEWVESTQTPLEYTGTGTPKNGSEFIVERRIDPSTGAYRNYYYYWVQNVQELSNQAATNAGRKFTTFDLARYLADPNGQGINTVSFISAGTQTTDNVASFIMSNLTRTLREDEQNIQINLSRNLNPIGLKHTAWKLLRENDNNSRIPEDLFAKLVDSLCEVDAAGNPVPANNLSEIEKYGVNFRPRQTMFKNPKEARRALHYLLNEILADIKINTLNPTWQSQLTGTSYIENVNWYAVQRVDGQTNEKIRYDESFKASFTVSSVRALDSISRDIADGTIVMVRPSQNDRYQLWRWCCRSLGFVQIAIQNETVRLRDSVYTDDINPTLQSELRSLLTALKDSVFAGTANINKVFFELVRYALGEQRELDWAFKTSYIYIEKEEEDLVQRIGFKPDNFDSVLDYLNEVKPYTAKIREYKDGKRAPIEYINNQMVSDYDFPPYADSSLGETRPLNINIAPDVDIMSTDTDYTKWYSEIQDHGNISNAIANTSPVRTGNVQIVFDRVDWRLLEADFNAAAKSYAVSIADNIADINAANVQQISDLSSNAYTASARIFKFDPEVRAQFNAEVDEYFGTGSSSNISIVESSANMLTAVSAGALVKTLYMVKQKVGGTWQGEELDANVFTQAVDGSDSLSLQSVYGYDTAPFDYTEGFGQEWDTFIQVRNFEGIFAGNSTFREEGVTYDGFDGWSFQHLLYGEERPEELVYLSPLENMVMHVRTDPVALDANGSPVDWISLGPYVADSISESDANNIVTVTSAIAAPLLSDGDIVTLSGTVGTILDSSYTISNLTSTTFTVEKAGVTANVITTAGNISITSGVEAVSTEYIVHQDLFGSTEYLRILTDGSTSTTTAAKVNAWDTEITVVDATVLPIPLPGVPGAAWLDHSERIEYTGITGNTLKGVTRGTRGTTVPGGPVYTYDGNVAIMSNTTLAHPAGVSVVGAGKQDVFDASVADGGSPGFSSRDPETANWLAGDGLQQSLTDVTNRSTVVTISAFLHGDLVSSIGFDSKGWDITGWDSI